MESPWEREKKINHRSAQGKWEQGLQQHLGRGVGGHGAEDGLRPSEESSCFSSISLKYSPVSLDTKRSSTELWPFSISLPHGALHAGCSPGTSREASQQLLPLLVLTLHKSKPQIRRVTKALTSLVYSGDSMLFVTRRN